MAMMIVEECINRGACEPEWPNRAIRAADTISPIDASRSTECVAAYDAPRCKEVSPVDSRVIVEPALVESREQLQEKYARLHA
jgi:hypothetical protein